MYRPARSLDVVLAEINAYVPNRSTASDGWLGDTAHQARPSDHNPNKAGVVRARDFTHDPAGGLNCNELATLLYRLLGKHPALGSGAYIIWNGRIVSTDRLSEGWRAYSGANPHTKHLHLSVGIADYDNGTPFNLWKDWFEMATKDELREVVREELARLFRINDGDKLPHIGNARVKSPNGERITTLARALGVTDPKE